MRSARTPAGIDISRNGSVCAVCKIPVAPSVAPSASTATICAADCAARLDQAKRWKVGGRRDGAIFAPLVDFIMIRSLSTGVAHQLEGSAAFAAPVVAAQLAFLTPSPASGGGDVAARPFKLTTVICTCPRRAGRSRWHQAY